MDGKCRLFLQQEVKDRFCEDVVLCVWHEMVWSRVEKVLCFDASWGHRKSFETETTRVSAVTSERCCIDCLSISSEQEASSGGLQAGHFARDPAFCIEKTLLDLFVLSSANVIGPCCSFVISVDLQTREATSEIFGWPVYKTWEFTSDHPIRSIFPLWLIYGLPLTLLKWIWEGLGYGNVSPLIAYNSLRIVMSIFSIVLEDWAIDEIIPNKNRRLEAIFLVSSSYVTSTYQTHTLSNSIETLIVLWCIVLIQRIINNQNRTQITACIVLAFLGVLGNFNRITFPAWLTIPALQLIPHLFKKPKRIFVLAGTAILVALYAVALDSEYYAKEAFHLRNLTQHLVITPFNNFAYNIRTSNLAEHGLHPFWQHFVANLPQLLGPATILCFISAERNSIYWTAIAGIAVLSIFQHQEPRFLIPAVPLLLSAVKVPERGKTTWIAIWLIFNLVAALLFGIFHQGGVVPAQNWVAGQQNISQVLWWKTYSPPRWLLGSQNDFINTTDLMGMKAPLMLEELKHIAACDDSADRRLLVAPTSATFLDRFNHASLSDGNDIQLEPLWQYRQHIGLDDLDFGDEGIWPTLSRVIGRRGLTIWNVRKPCDGSKVG
ncbi:hypothetical protein MRB53_037978 [Persea americana]|nr:hypothetical protein MRB53_037978 [Persea americana]